MVPGQPDKIFHHLDKSKDNEEDKEDLARSQCLAQGSTRIFGSYTRACTCPCKDLLMRRGWRGGRILKILLLNRLKNFV